MKKFPLPLSILTAIVFAIFATQSTFAKSFPDIEPVHNNFNAINYLSERDIIKGYDDGYFRPDQQITRAELTKMILEANKIPIKNYQKNCFPDSGYLEWYNNFLCTAKEKNFIKGYEDGTFKPEQFINKVEALKIIAEIYEWEIEFEETPGAFSDTPSDNWYIDYILYGLEKNLFQGFDKNSEIANYQFEPEKFITRAEVAEILYRYLVITELDKNSFYPDLQKNIQQKNTTDKNIQKKSDIKPTTLTNGEIKIILSWEIPEKTGLTKTKSAKTKTIEPKLDFDSHLIQPTDEEIDFSHKIDSKLETILEIKDNTETINILKLKKNEKLDNQIKNYLYFVNHFSGEKGFSEVKVKVTIYDQNGLAKTFNSYKNPGKIWKLFELNENYELTIFNTIGGCELINRNSTACPIIPEN